MATLYYSHPACLDHDTGRNHPECPDRLRAIEAALKADAFAALDRREAPQATREQIGRVHPQTHIDAVLAAIPKTGAAYLDPDTVVSAGSAEAGLRAAGAGVAAVDAVISGEAETAFCTVRPPGHHAEPERAMGFCFFNNVAIAALHARVAHGLDRVAVVDFDVHHGNGTQAAFEADASLFYASTHQYPHYPGTGAASETGVGNIVNVPLAPGSGGAEFRDAVTSLILPALEAFAPDLVLISAGFDAHRDDPLASLNFVEDDYVWVTTALVALARRHAAGRVVSMLEGGYDFGALGRSTAAHIGELMRVAD